MPDKITTLKLVDNTDVFPNIKDENIPDTIMRIADLSKYVNQLKSINITGDVVSATTTSGIATFTTADISTLNVSGIATFTTADISTLNVSGISRFEGEATFGHNVHVDGNLFVNGIDNMVDKNGNKIINTGTFDPTSDNPASQKSVYDMPIQFENIIDKNGHRRFIEGYMHFLSPKPESINITYAKWSLSGSHFMMVVCGTIAKNVESTNNFSYFTNDLPNWIMDKIHPLRTAGNLVGSANMYIFDSAIQDEPNYRDSIIIPIHKWDSVGGLGFYTYGNFKTFDYDGVFRVEFDLLIDNA